MLEHFCTRFFADLGLWLWRGAFIALFRICGGVNLVLLHVGALFVPGSLLIMVCGGGGGLFSRCMGGVNMVLLHFGALLCIGLRN